MMIPFIFRSKRAQELSPLPECADEMAEGGLEPWRIPDTLVQRDPRDDLFRLTSRREHTGDVDIRARLRRCR